MIAVSSSETSAATRIAVAIDECGGGMHARKGRSVTALDDTDRAATVSGRLARHHPQAAAFGRSVGHRLAVMFSEGNFDPERAARRPARR
jgi:hypothetical protein